MLTKEWIKNRFALEGAIAKISSLLLSLKQIHLTEVLEILGEAISVNRVFILMCDENSSVLKIADEWCDSSVKSIRQGVIDKKLSQFKWIVERLQQNENVMIADSTALPLESKKEKDFFQSIGVRSLLFIPIHSSSGVFLGAICFENSTHGREWLGEEVQALKIVAEMISRYWESKEAQQALVLSEQRYRQLYNESKKAEEVYRSLINSSADAIVISDLGGITRYVSPAFTRLFGWTQDEVIDKEIPYIPLVEKKIFIPLFNGVVRGDSCQALETKLITKENKLMDISLSMSRYNDHEGNPSGVLSILRDISESKKLEAQLIQAQKMEAIGTLAGGIAHDFNNILQAIFGCTEILLMGKDDEHPDYQKLQTIEKSAQRAGNLTRRLMVFSRKMESEFVLIDLNNVVDQMSIILKRTIPKMINIRLDLDENPCTIKADAVQLEQIMMNVAINARDAMPEGGCLTYKTRNIEINQVSGDINPGLTPGEYALLSISDTGHGIEKVTINRIFEPFFTTKKKGEGTGLGLAMVYGIVKNHSGYITCSSEVSKGTTFDIYFPVVKGYSINKELDKRKDYIKGGNETILLVDDEKSNREIGKEILLGFGYNVIPAANGEEALECYGKNKDTIDLVILDLIMPGIGGRKCLEKLIEEDPDINVIISSGYSASKAVSDALDAGAKGFIGKPYNLKKMLEVIRSVFD